MVVDKKRTFVEHLDELRSRILKSSACVLLVSLLFFYCVEKIFPYIIKPVGSLVFIAPAEAFITYIKVAFFGGIFLSSPFVIYQIWKFVSIGLNENERRYVMIFGPTSLLLFVVGTCFGYFIIMPIGLKFLLGFATDFMSPMITVSKYISFAGMLTLAFGVIFELPIVISFLTKIGLVTPAFLATKRKHAIVFIFITAALLTPPDVVTQTLMAVPLLALYEISIILSRLIYKPVG